MVLVPAVPSSFADVELTPVTVRSWVDWFSMRSLPLSLEARTLPVEAGVVVDCRDQLIDRLGGDASDRRRATSSYARTASGEAEVRVSERRAGAAVAHDEVAHRNRGLAAVSRRIGGEGELGAGRTGNGDAEVGGGECGVQASHHFRAGDSGFGGNGDVVGYRGANRDLERIGGGAVLDRDRVVVALPSSASLKSSLSPASAKSRLA